MQIIPLCGYKGDMSHLKKALGIWIQAGHNQAEFSKITGVEQSLCSRIFAGSRGFTLSQRKAVFAAFQEIDFRQGLIFLKADLEDQTPPDARKSLRLVIELPTSVREESAPTGDPVDQARRGMIKDLEAKDPTMLAMAVALHEWRK